MGSGKEIIKRCVVSVAAGLLVLLVCIAILMPPNAGGIYQPSSEATQTIAFQNHLAHYNCEIDADNCYTILGSDPQIVFQINKNAIECVQIRLREPVETAVSLELYTAYDDCVFSAERCYIGCILMGETSTVIDIPLGEYAYLRVDVDDPGVVLEDISVYAQQPQIVAYTPNHTKTDYICTVLLPLLAAIAVFILDCYTHFWSKFVDAVKRNKKWIALILVLTVLTVLLSVGIEILLSMQIVNDGVFNVYRAAFIAGVIGVVFAVAFGWRCLKDRPENLFLAIVLIVGFAMIFTSPIKHICWDLDSHYPWAVHTSYVDTVYLTGADMNVDKVHSESLIANDFTVESYEEDLERLNELDEMIAEQKPADASLAHLPAAVMIAVSRLFGAGFSVKYTLGRIAFLLVYAFVCYFAVRKLQSGKMILAVICLIPTNIFMATNYSYDYWVNAFVALGMAYYVSEIQRPDQPISIKDTVIMCGAFALAALPKLIYIILMFVPIFMYKKWNSKKDRRIYYAILLSMFAVVFLMFLMTSLTAVTGDGDSRGGSVDPSGQIRFILSQPLAYAKTLGSFLLDYLSIGRMREYISHFAYLGVGNMWGVVVALICITALTDTTDRFRFKIPVFIRVCAVLLFVGMSALIATALYIDFSPLGSETINGCQPRYIIPLLPPLLLLATGERFHWIKHKAVYNGIVLMASAAVVLCETYSLIVVRML